MNVDGYVVLQAVVSVGVEQCEHCRYELQARGMLGSALETRPGKESRTVEG